jgi:hypothetical protein
MNSIEYKNESYPVKVITAVNDVDGDGQPTEYRISIEGLNRVLSNDIENGSDEVSSEAYEVDSAIYFYVDNSMFNESDEYIANHGLDVPMTLHTEQ